MASVGGVKVSAHYCGPHVPDPDARPRSAGGVGALGDATAEAAAAARVAEVVASNARLIRATCPHLETAPHRIIMAYSGYTYSGYSYSGYSDSGYTTALLTMRSMACPSLRADYGLVLHHP